AVALRCRDALLALDRADLLRTEVARDVRIALLKGELLVGRLWHVLDEDARERRLRAAVVRVGPQEHLGVLGPVVDDVRPTAGRVVEEPPRSRVAARLVRLHFLRVDDATDGEGEDREEALRARGLGHAHDDGAPVGRLDALGLEPSY